MDRERDWLIPVAFLMAIELSAWWALYAAELAHPPAIAGYQILAFTALAPVLCFRLLSTPRPLERLRQMAREDPARIGGLVAGMQLFVLGASLFGALKAAIPKLVPFWLDGPLAQVERTVFGTDPWQLSNLLLGWATPAIDIVYASFLPIHLLAVFTLLAAAPSRAKTRALVSLYLAWLVVGVGGAFALSSVGPIFYDRAFGGGMFSALTQTLHAAAPIAVRTSDLMWQYHVTDTPAVATGISAMPSMHVGLSLWLALISRGRRYAPLAWIYYSTIWLGSVHLGWHYVSDGLVASVAMLLLWRAAGTLLLSRGRASEPAAVQPNAAC